MSEIDLRPLVGAGLQQSARNVRWQKIIDFSRCPLTRDQHGLFLVLPAGFVFDSADYTLLRPEGSQAFVEVGTATIENNWLDGGVADSPAGTILPPGLASSTRPGDLYPEATGLYVTPDPALSHAVLKVVIGGYLTDV